MARRGPKPKTAGNYQPDKTESLPIPAGMTGRARDEYARVLRKLKAAGTLDAADPTLIEQYAMAAALAQAARVELDRDGLTVATESGRPVAHPMVSIWNSATIRLARLSGALGLGKPGTGEAPEESDGEWADLLSITG